jgi:hypothetical protein
LTGKVSVSEWQFFRIASSRFWPSLPGERGPHRIKEFVWSKDMKTFAIAALLVVHLTSALAGTAQQPDSLQVNASYQCSNGMTVTVTRCAKQNGLENCEFKIEQNGKLAFQGVNLREKVAAGVKSCRAQAGSSSSI